MPYVPTGISDEVRIAVGDLGADPSSTRFRSESAIPEGIAAERIGIISESSIISIVHQGELFTTALGEAIKVLVPVTDLDGTTYDEEVTYLDVGLGQEALQAVGDKPAPDDSQYSDTSNPTTSESEVPATVSEAEQVEDDTGYEDPGATHYYVDGQYVDASTVPTPTYDPYTDPYYVGDPAYYNEGG
jgi:hypothetical protein